MHGLSLPVSDLSIYALAITLLVGFITLLVGSYWTLTEANWHSKNSDNASPVCIHLILTILCIALSCFALMAIYNLLCPEAESDPYFPVNAEPVAMVCIPSDDYKALNLNELNQLRN